MIPTIIAAGILVPFAAAGVPVVMSRRARARQQRVEDAVRAADQEAERQRAAADAVRTAEQAAAQAAQAERARVADDPVGALIPIVLGVADQLHVPQVQVEQARARRDAATAEVERIEKRVHRAKGRLPGWLKSPAGQAMAIGAVLVFIAVFVTHLVLDHDAFEPTNSGADAWMYAAIAVVTMAVGAVMACEAFRRGWPERPSAQAGRTLVAAWGVLMVAAAFVIVIMVAPQRTQGPHGEAVAKAQAAKAALQSAHDNGEAVSQFQIDAANTDLAQAQADRDSAAALDRVMVAAAAVTEVALAEVVFRASPLGFLWWQKSRRRTAKQVQQDGDRAVARAEAALRQAVNRVLTPIYRWLDECGVRGAAADAAVSAAFSRVAMVAWVADLVSESAHRRGPTTPSPRVIEGTVDEPPVNESGTAGGGSATCGGGGDGGAGGDNGSNPGEPSSTGPAPTGPETAGPGTDEPGRAEPGTTERPTTEPGPAEPGTPDPPRSLDDLDEAL